MPRAEIMNSIKVKAMTAFLIAGSVPMIVSMGVINHRTQQNVLAKAEAGLEDTANMHGKLLDDHIQAFRDYAKVLAKVPAIIQFSASHAQGEPVLDQVLVNAGSELAGFQSEFWGEAHHMFIVDRDGTVILSAPEIGWGDGHLTVEQMENSAGPHTSKVVSGLDYSGNTIINPMLDDCVDAEGVENYHPLVLNPIRDESGEVLGLVVIELSIDFIVDLFGNNFTYGATEKVYVTTNQGHRIVSEKVGLESTVKIGSRIIEETANGQMVSGWFESADGVEIFGAYKSSETYPWIVCVEVDRDEIQTPLNAQSWFFIAISAASIAVFAGAIVLVGRWFWGPLKKVVAAANRVADGDLWHEIEVTRTDEIGQLEGAVDAMRVSMKQQIDHLDALVAERTSELEYANEKLEIDAEQDRLTTLANRQKLRLHLDEEMVKYHQDESHLVSVLFFDFDRFKVVNDSLGHSAGDALLCSIADRFRNELRKTDLPARFGGDEFVVMLAPVESPEHAYQAADRLVKIFAEPHDIDGHRIVSTASIGLVIADKRYVEAGDMIRDADAAMYEAKLAGKNQVAVFDEKMFAAAKRRQRIEEDLSCSIKNDELCVMYQPIIGMESMDVVGFEALIRWEHPELGMVSPVDFITIAEDTGQIIEVGAWVFREAVEQLVRWDEQYGLDETHSMNINVSKRQLIHPEFLSMVQDVLHSTGIKPSRVKVEITESTVIDPRHDMSVVINRVRDLGVMIAMDDFGTGHSSLSLLHKFDFDILKVDQSFVQGMEESREMSAVLHAIIALAQNTGMKVVAEGAETKEQVICLISHGCDMVQGYYFAKPLKAVEAGQMLNRPLGLGQAA